MGFLPVIFGERDDDKKKPKDETPDKNSVSIPQDDKWPGNGWHKSHSGSNSDPAPNAPSSRTSTETDDDDGPEPTITDDGGGENHASITAVTSSTVASTDRSSGAKMNESETSPENTSGKETVTPHTTSTPTFIPTPTATATATPPLSPISTPTSPSISMPETTSVTATVTIPTLSSIYTSSLTSSDQASVVGGSGSDSGSGSGSGSGGGNESGTKDSNTSINAQTVPTWAIPLMVIGIVMGLTFLAALVFFCIKERRKKEEDTQGGKKPSYTRAVGKALIAATLLFIPIWIVNRLREWSRKREEKMGERDRKYQEQVMAYAKLGDEREREHEQEEEQERGLVREQEDRRLEEGVVIADRSVSPVSAPTLAPPTSPVGRSPSMVSSLSSRSQGSQGQYERLENIVPSPVTEETPYVWRPPRPPDTQAGNPEGRGAVPQTEMGSRRDSDIPTVLRPGGGGGG
ncbi:hypothetical protein F4776DRAFT_647673 [Hypoxylon sp. NC0597]|nr:hypothetical protein F4776DRAFT_647673 [Hypoxylon sp. NC0597]